MVALAAGALLSPLAFVFGGLAGLLALPAVIPKLKGLRPAAYSYFGGVVVCWVLSAAGVNPWLEMAKSAALERMEAALGAPVEYDRFEGDAPTGEMQFHNLRVTLPGGAGTLAAELVEIHAGYGMFVRTGPVVVGARAVVADLDPESGKLDRYLAREMPKGGEAELHLFRSTLHLRGKQTHATFEVSEGHGSFGEDGSELRVAFRAATVTLLGQAHELVVRGGLVVQNRGGTLIVSTNLTASIPDVAHGVLHGTLQPGGGGALVCTIDYIDMDAMWERYRKVDRLRGTLRGTFQITGDLNDLHIEASGEVLALDYFHRAVMALDESRSFRMDRGLLSGALRLRHGEHWVFDGLCLRTDACSLATDPRMQASGSGTLTLDGPVESLRGKLDVVVESARLAEPITWSPVSDRSLSDVQPNLVMIGEQFKALILEWQVEVKAMEVACQPLSGKAAGKLRGTFTKEDGKRVGTLRVEGNLTLNDGRFEFLGAAGSIDASVEFNPNGPSMHATLRGKLKGSVGKTPLAANISGTLYRPAFGFTGVDMAPDTLGKKIFDYSEAPLTATEIVARREACSRLCGVQAAMLGNPFAARDTGKVFFSFSPSPDKD